jgi:DNA polymerase-3 subunit delta'
MKTAAFNGFIGQGYWQEYFSNLVRERRLGHAYIFSGPKHVGKRTFVWELARHALCQTPTRDGGACNKCRSCRAWRGEIHPELVVLSRAEDKASVGVLDVRNFIGALVNAPSESVYRLGLIENIEAVTIEGLNMLLKTLEEPAPSVVLLLLTDAVERLPATVRSRLQHCVFVPVPESKLIEALRERGASHAVSEELAALAAGRPGLALTWLAEPAALKAYGAAGEKFLDLCAGSMEDRFAFSETVASAEDCSALSLDNLLAHWTLMFRDILLLLGSGPRLVTHKGLLERYAKFIERDTLDVWFSRYRALELARQALGRNANRRLALNTFFINF